MKTLMIGILMMLACSAQARTFEINWDLEAEAGQATELAWKIYYAQSGGIDGLIRASQNCFESQPSYEITQDVAFCMAFDAAVMSWVADEGETVAEKILLGGGYFDARNMMIRHAQYFQDWSTAGSQPFITRIYTASRKKHDAMVQEAVQEFKKNG